ncbi:hypothetical protein Tco_1244202 [Tanacetum coccineum]
MRQGGSVIQPNANLGVHGQDSLNLTGAYNVIEALHLVLSIFCFLQGTWQISEAHRQYLKAEYDDYSATNSSGAVFCRLTVKGEVKWTNLQWKKLV